METTQKETQKETQRETQRENEGIETQQRTKKGCWEKRRKRSRNSSFLRMQQSTASKYYGFHDQCLQHVHRKKAEKAKQSYQNYGRSCQSTCPVCNALVFQPGSNNEIKQLLGWATQGHAWAYSELGQRYKILNRSHLSFQMQWV